MFVAVVCLFVFLVGRGMTGSKFVPSIKNIVREICISSCEGKYPDWHNAKFFFLKSQRGRLRVQWKHNKLSECKRIFPGTCKPTYKSWWNQWRNGSYCWTLNRSNWMSIRVHAQKNETHSVRAKNADCTCIHSTKNKVQRWALWLCTYTFQPCSQFPCVWDCWIFYFRLSFGLNWKKKQTTTTTPSQEGNFFHASGVSSHYIVLHPVSSRASRTSGILVQFIRHSCLIDYHNIWLDFSHWCYFGSSKRTFALYIDLDTSTLLHDSRNRKYITTTLWPCQLFFVKCRRATCIIIYGLKHGKLDIQLKQQLD